MNEGPFVLPPRYRLLLHGVLNEVLNGFELNDFGTVIGAGESDLRRLFVSLDQLPDDVEIRLTFHQTRALRNALRETLRELGEEEFHTRTGVEFEFGESALEYLNQLVTT